MEKSNAGLRGRRATALLDVQPECSRDTIEINGAFGALPKPIRDVFATPTDTDLLSDVLAALRVDSSGLCVGELREPWAVQIVDFPMPHSWTVLEGTVWMQWAGMAPIAFHRGDTFLFPRGIGRTSCVLASSIDVRPVALHDVWRQAELQGYEPGASSRHPQYLRWGGTGNLTRIVSTVFTFRDRQLSPLIAALPELMVVRAAEAEGGGELIDAMMRFTLGSENTDLSGYRTLAKQIAQLLLTLVVRANSLSDRNSSLGWLAGLGDPQIARVLARIYREPDRRWTVAALARAAGMSRSVFAERFLTRVGQTPMRYLRAWRMHLASEALAGGSATVTMLAQDLGYQSEAAFRTAFRSATGQPPREFRRNAEIVQCKRQKKT